MQPDEVNLLEDGLQLWVVSLRNAPGPDPGLLGLFPRLPPIMQSSTGALLLSLTLVQGCGWCLARGTARLLCVTMQLAAGCDAHTLQPCMTAHCRSAAAAECCAAHMQAALPAVTCTPLPLLAASL